MTDIAWDSASRRHFVKYLFGKIAVKQLNELQDIKEAELVTDEDGNMECVPTVRGIRYLNHKYDHDPENEFDSCVQCEEDEPLLKYLIQFDMEENEKEE